MELAFSPDLPAWACYLIVLLFGLFAAASRVHTRLQTSLKIDIVPVWRFGQSWLLLILYTFAALALFWLLDRTDAIHDTSLFAALIVAFAFERIVAGNHASLSVPEGVGGIWSPFQAFADRSIVKIGKLVHRDAERFNRVVIDVLSDAPRLEALKRLAVRATADQAGLTAALAKIENERAAKGDNYVLEVTARTLIEAVRTSTVLGTDHWEKLLYQEEVIDRRTYYRASAIVRSRASMAVVCVVLATALIFGGVAIRGSSYWHDYHLWRIEKSNTTVTDLHRTRNALRLLLKEPTLAPHTYDALIELIRVPELSIERANAVLGLLLEQRCHIVPANYPLQANLVSALRTDNVDIRNRINQVLVFMASKTAVDQSLKDWNPTEVEAVTVVEAKIDLWRTNLTQTGQVSTCKPAQQVRPSDGTALQSVDS